MNELSCRQVEELLIDYSDVELEAGLAAQVAAHLEHCAECRQQLARLETSLGLAGEIWEESARTVSDIDTIHVHRRFAPARRVVLIMASTAAVILAGLFVWSRPVQHDAPLSGARPLGGKPDHAVAHAQDTDNFPRELRHSEGELLALISRAERQARLRVSLELLEQTPALRSYAEEAEQYLVANFSDLDNPVPVDNQRSPGIQEESL